PATGRIEVVAHITSLARFDRLIDDFKTPEAACYPGSLKTETPVMAPSHREPEGCDAPSLRRDHRRAIGRSTAYVRTAMKRFLAVIAAHLIATAVAGGSEYPAATKEGADAVARLTWSCLKGGGLKVVKDPANGEERVTVADEAKLRAVVAANR